MHIGSDRSSNAAVAESQRGSMLPLGFIATEQSKRVSPRASTPREWAPVSQALPDDGWPGSESSLSESGNE
jgi:hypothetical protein